MLSITTTYNPATDLGYLLHKNPLRTHSIPLPFGHAYIFYPEASPTRCTAVLFVDINPLDLVRPQRTGKSADHTLRHYVNDRPYAASSFLSVAIQHAFGTALSGKSKERPELVLKPIPLQAKLSLVRSDRGESLLRSLFEPLGYRVVVQPHLRDGRFPEWGESEFFTLSLEATCTLGALLRHLYVLIPVLDEYKHYWVGEDEVEKLLRRGQEWLAAHPERDLIVRRYLKHIRGLTHQALTRLMADDQLDPDTAEAEHAAEEETIERPLSLQERRIQGVLTAVREAGVRSVIDLGCGSGSLLQALLKEPMVERIAGMDVSSRALEIARERLRLDTLPPRQQQQRIALFHGSLVYRDRRITGYDAVIAMEVIEHLDTWRLAAFERVVFERSGAPLVIITTPNMEYNPKFERLPAGAFRHRDHRFEWTRAEFQQWAANAAGRYGYSLQVLPIGPEDPEVGAPTQMAIFRRNEADG